MSLSNTEPPKTYPVGIIASKSLDDANVIPEFFLGKISGIAHIYTNGANDLVAKFAADNSLPITTFPITGDKSLPLSLSQIAENVSFALIIADENSKSAKMAVDTFVKKGITHKIINFEPSTHYQEKLCKIAKIVAVMTPEDRQKNEWVRAIERVLN